MVMLFGDVSTVMYKEGGQSATRIHGMKECSYLEWTMDGCIIKERFSNGTTVVLRYVLTHLLAVQTRGLREVARSCLLGFLKLHDSFCRVHRSMLQLQLQFYLGLNMLGI